MPKTGNLFVYGLDKSETGSLDFLADILLLQVSFLI